MSTPGELTLNPECGESGAFLGTNYESGNPPSVVDCQRIMTGRYYTLQNKYTEPVEIFEIVPHLVDF